MSVVVSVAVVTDNPEHVAKAAEVLARAAAGLALEGIDVMVSIATPVEEEETDSQGSS